MATVPERQTMTAAEWRALKQRPNKYGNTPTLSHGILFASKAEVARYEELLLLERGDIIDGLTIQPSWKLVVNGVSVGFYRADFSYIDHETGRLVVEDVKGGEATKTPVYRLKKKLLFACHGLIVTEVEA